MEEGKEKRCAASVTKGSIEAIKVASGEGKAWESLCVLDPLEVAVRADVRYDDASGLYVVPSFGDEFLVSPSHRSVSSRGSHGEMLLSTPEYFFRLSILWYLVCAKDLPLSGRLVNPVHVKGGLMFAQGTHILPLEELAARYDNDREGFEKLGEQLGGSVVGYGDTAVQLRPFPRVPVVVALWLSDDEFPARAELMFDATCDCHLPTDVLWSVATMTVLLLLRDRM